MSTTSPMSLTTDAPNAPGKSRAASIDLVPMITIGLAIFSLCIVGLMIGLASGVRGDDVPMLLWALVTIMAGFGPLVIDAGRPRENRHVFLSMLALAYTLQFVMPIFVLYIPAVGPVDPQAMGDANLMPADIIHGQWIALIGLLAFYAGYAVPLRPLAQRLLPTRGHEWNRRAAVAAALILVVFGWFFYLGRNFGLIPAALGSGVIGGLASATIFSSSILMAIYLKYRSRFALLLMMSVVPVTMAINFISGSKKAVLLPAAMIVLTWVVTERRIRLRWIAAGFLALILLYPVAQFWRMDILQNNTLSMTHVLTNPGPALARTGNFLSSGRAGDYFEEGFEAASRRLDGIGVVSVLVRDTPSVSPFQNGRTIALIPLAYIPRVIWPDKPVITIGKWVTEAYVPGGHLVESHVGTTWVGEFYLNWGVPAVLMGMLVLGAMLRGAHEVLMRGVQTIPLVVAATIVISQCSLAMQGGVVVAVNGPVVTLIPLALAHGAMRLLGGTRLMDLGERETES